MDKIVDKLEFSHTASGDVKWGSCCGNGPAVPQKANIKLPPYPEFQAEADTQRTGNIDPHRNLYRNVHSIIIHNSQKVETTKCPSTNNWVNKTQNIHTTEHCPTIKRNKVLIHAAKQMNLGNTILSDRSQTQKVYCMTPFLCNPQDRHLQGDRK